MIGKCTPCLYVKICPPVVLAAFAIFAVVNAGAATAINVNSHLDILNGSDGLCTLREAIIAANTDTASGGAAGECPAGSGSDTILLPAGVYTYTIAGKFEDLAQTGDLDILEDVSITGAGSACFSGLPDCTKVNANQTDRIFDIFAPTHLSLSHMQIQGGTDSGFAAGGIYNRGDLTLDHVLVIGNFTSSNGGGLVITSGASAEISNSSFATNQANYGGAILNTGTLNMNSASLTFNTSYLGGGGIYNEGIATLDQVNISINEATEASGDGGGIYNAGVMTVTNSLINGNSALGTGGGIFINGSPGVTMTNVTLTENDANDGGGIGTYFTSGPMMMLNVTIAGNTAANGSAVFQDTSAALKLQNTIIGINTGAACSASISSLGNNIDSGNTCNLTGAGDMINADPLLGTLQDNGGKTETLALLDGSPAIDGGTNDSCPSTDQRGILRPRDGNLDGTATCDIGAFEVEPVSIYLPLVARTGP